MPLNHQTEGCNAWRDLAQCVRQWIGRSVLGFVSLTRTCECVIAQAPAPPVSQTTAVPEPIYWKQHLFLIPYQWGSAADPGTVQAVWLFVSKDRGANWQKISEAKPQVKAFNYNAEGEGEYWFAVKTIDTQGRMWPAGPYQAELRVVVDTSVPRIEQLACWMRPDGAVEVQWRSSDRHIEPSSLRIEAQSSPQLPWQPVTLVNVTQPAGVALPALDGVYAGQAIGQLPASTMPMLIRATIADRAGNSATYQSPVSSTPPVAGPVLTLPTVGNTTNSIGAPNSTPTLPSGNLTTQSLAPGGVSQPVATVPMPAPTAVNQQWPAAEVSRTPFRLFTGTTAASDDGVTAYGSLPVVEAPRSSSAASMVPTTTRLNASIANDSSIGTTGNGALKPITSVPQPQFSSVEPFRQVSMKRLPSTDHSLAIGAGQLPITPLDTPARQVVSNPAAPSSPPKRVGSRTFSLEYDLNQVGQWGVSKVELWGSRDGGRTWRNYARDDDHRSPLLVTVDEEGTYGFRIVVDSVGAGSTAPAPGDAPELWVDVDLRRPVVELTGIERGIGNQADHLILRWRADDGNLESRPISLYFSSRPSGPWSTVATNLENTGVYAWRVERYVPERFFLRLEARDTAGNLAAFQTREPIAFAPDTLNARLRPDNTAPPAVNGNAVDYR